MLQQYFHFFDHYPAPSSTIHPDTKNQQPNTQPTQIKALKFNTFKQTDGGVQGVLGLSALAWEKNPPPTFNYTHPRAHAKTNPTHPAQHLQSREIKGQNLCGVANIQPNTYPTHPTHSLSKSCCGRLDMLPVIDVPPRQARLRPPRDHRFPQIGR